MELTLFCAVCHIIRGRCKSKRRKSEKSAPKKGKKTNKPKEVVEDI
jgi:hypothetical protein